jgi:hypothetical protein
MIKKEAKRLRFFWWRIYGTSQSRRLRPRHSRGRFFRLALKGPASPLFIYICGVFSTFVVSSKCVRNVFASVWPKMIVLCRIR